MYILLMMPIFIPSKVDPTKQAGGKPKKGSKKATKKGSKKSTKQSTKKGTKKILLGINIG